MDVTVELLEAIGRYARHYQRDVINPHQLYCRYPAGSFPSACGPHCVQAERTVEDVMIWVKEQQEALSCESD